MQSQNKQSLELLFQTREEWAQGGVGVTQFFKSLEQMILFLKTQTLNFQAQEKRNQRSEKVHYKEEAGNQAL